MKYKQLTVIGTSHVSIESVNEVKRTIEDIKPGIVAIELDKDRLMSLLHKNGKTRLMKGIGFKGMLFAMIGAWIEKKIGKIVKVAPGSEMKMAVISAKKINAKVALIDQHISITLRRFSETLTWTEKWHFIVDIFGSMFTPNKYIKKVDLKHTDLRKVPDKKTIKKILKYFKKRYPNVHNILVHERNVYMAKQLTSLMTNFPNDKIVAVVGAGHEEDIIAMIKQNLYKKKKRSK